MVLLLRMAVIKRVVTPLMISRMPSEEHRTKKGVVEDEKSETSIGRALEGTSWRFVVKNDSD